MANIYKDAFYKAIIIIQMNLQGWQSKVNSRHALMANFLCFNSVRSKFITCGEDGEIHVYSLNKNGQSTHMGFANLFKQSIVCVSWACPAAGGCIAVGGSKGTLSIIHIDNNNGQVLIQKSFQSSGSTPSSLDWHPDRKMLICGTIDGKYYRISFIQQQWIQQQIIQIKKGSPVQVAWGPCENPIQFCAADSIFYFLQRKQENTFLNQKKMLCQFPEQKIKRILVRHEGLSDKLQLILFTNKKMRVCQFAQGRLQIIQQIKVDKLNISQINWGWNQNQLVCYSFERYRQKNKEGNQNQNVIVDPIVMRREINGVWYNQGEK